MQQVDQGHFLTIPENFVTGSGDSHSDSVDLWITDGYKSISSPPKISGIKARRESIDIQLHEDIPFGGPDRTGDFRALMIAQDETRPYIGSVVLHPDILNDLYPQPGKDQNSFTPARRIENVNPHTAGIVSGIKSGMDKKRLERLYDYDIPPESIRVLRPNKLPPIIVVAPRMSYSPSAEGDISVSESPLEGNVLTLDLSTMFPRDKAIPPFKLGLRPGRGKIMVNPNRLLSSYGTVGSISLPTSFDIGNNPEDVLVINPYYNSGSPHPLCDVFCARMPQGWQGAIS